MTTAPFATARLEGHEVVLTIGDEQCRYDNSLNGYQSAHAIADWVNRVNGFHEMPAEEQALEIDAAHAAALIEDAERDEPPTKVEGQRRSNPPEGLAPDEHARWIAEHSPITTPTGEKPAA